jgi:H(+)-translocating pyrophosphatase
MKQQIGGNYQHVSVTLLLVTVLLLCLTNVMAESNYKIELLPPATPFVTKANTMFNETVQVRVTDATGASVHNLTLYFFTLSTERMKPFFNSSVVRTNEHGIASTVMTAGFSVGDGVAFVSNVPRKSFDPKRDSFANIKFQVKSVLYTEAWIQMGLLLGLSVISVFGSFALAIFLMRKDTGTPKMQEIAKSIQQGANGFLRTQYLTIAVMSVPLAVALLLMYGLRQKSLTDPDIKGIQWVTAIITALSFMLGAILSGISGFIGMFVSVRANVRVTAAARRSYNEALGVATRAGAFAGFLVVALSVLGVGFIFTLLYAVMPQDKVDPQQIVGMIVGFSFGCSLAALFAQLGGGIFTKAADVGADLVGKVEEGIPEDDERNPAVIADLVGDNVGDCAGRGADLFESISAENIGVMILAGTLCSNAYPQIATPVSYIVFPLVVHVTGMIGSWIGIFCVRVSDSKTKTRIQEERASLLNEPPVNYDQNDTELTMEELDNPMTALNIGLTVASVITTALFIPVCYWLLHSSIYPKAWWCFMLCGLIGILTSWAFVFITVYYTDYNWRPVKSIAESSRTGAATNVISGFAVGLESTGAPVIVIAIAILAAYYLGRFSGIRDAEGELIAGLFGIAVATIGMLTSSSYILTMDTLGPIVDNAGGIAEMSNLPQSIRLVTDRLDAVGNTTKALTKGYAIGSASLAAFLLFSALLDTITSFTGRSFTIVNLATPEIFVGGLCGACLVFVFSSLTIRAVGNSAQTVIQEVRRQFKEFPGIMDRSSKPDYERCVAIVTRSALIQMIVPGLLAVLVPVSIGFIFRLIGLAVKNPLLGAEVAAGFLIVATIAGILMALTLNNAGGSWDNAKKLAEMDPSLGGKGSDIHKATVIGDTIGDPFKDTAGPSLHVLIKLLATITLVVGPLFVNLKQLNELQ